MSVGMLRGMFCLALSCRSKQMWFNHTPGSLVLGQQEGGSQGDWVGAGGQAGGCNNPMYCAEVLRNVESGCQATWPVVSMAHHHLCLQLCITALCDYLLCFYGH